MSLIKTYTFTLAAVSTTAIAAAQTTAGAANLSLNGSGVVNGTWTTPDSTVKKVSMASTGNIATVVFTITGKLMKGGPDVTDTITGINNSTVTSTQYFYSVSNIAASAAVGTNVTAGFGQAAATQPIVSSLYLFDRLSASLEIVSGTTSVSLQHTLSDMLLIGMSSSYTEALAGWLANDATVPLTNLTSGQTACFFQTPVSAVRVLINSYSSSPVIRLRLVESVE